MIYYQHKTTGNVVEVMEPREFGEYLIKNPPSRRGRPLDQDQVKGRMKMRTRTLAKMDSSWKWERVDKGLYDASNAPKASAKKTTAAKK